MLKVVLLTNGESPDEMPPEDQWLGTSSTPVVNTVSYDPAAFGE
jgi:hypothetical protein